MPMAGRGARFANEGYQTPKPLIEVNGKPMFTWALKSLKKVDYRLLIIIALDEHEKEYHLSKLINTNCDKRTVLLTIPKVTDGQLCTVLTAKEMINTEEDILIMASDSYIVSNIGTHINNLSSECKGLISVINLPGDKYSFAKVDESGKVIKVAEKLRISNHASTGMYYFKSGKEFVEIGEGMIANKELTKGEYYVIPVYQKMIENGKTIEISEANEMWDLGTPEAKSFFEENFLP